MNTSENLQVKAHETVDNVSAGMHEAVDRVAETAERVSDNVCEKTKSVQEKQERLAAECRDYIRENPLTSVAMAIGAGYLLSKLLSR